MPNIDIEEANSTALSRIIEAEPVLVDVVPASRAINGLSEGMLLHAGPPISWERMCGPMHGAIVGALRYEGWAATEADALVQASGGQVAFHPAHHFSAVGPMTGITSPSMPVFVVEDRAHGNRAYCTINEGLGRVLRFGANDDAAIEKLRWMQNTLAPALGDAVRHSGGIELRPIMAQALTMSDEMHQRNVAATSLFFRVLSPRLARTCANSPDYASIIDFLVANDQFFLNLAMAAAKCTLDNAANVEGSSFVYTMCRNGTDFGIRVSGLGDRWFTAPSRMPQGLYFPGYTVADSNPDLGDSAILETLGLGAFAMAGSPAVAGFLGAGTFRDALNYSREMAEITVGRNPNMAVPTLDFQGVPCGVDVRKVVETDIAPVINTGIAHKEPGIGQIGAGIVRAPMECFHQALEALAERLAGV